MSKIPQQYVNPKGCPRYPDRQDSNEEGLSLLRAQYENAGLTSLGWGETKPPTDRTVEIRVGDIALTIKGEPQQISALATLICRAVSLGWCMLNELEPTKGDQT